MDIFKKSIYLPICLSKYSFINEFERVKNLMIWNSLEETLTVDFNEKSWMILMYFFLKKLTISIFKIKQGQKLSIRTKVSKVKEIKISPSLYITKIKVTFCDIQSTERFAST